MESTHHSCCPTRQLIGTQLPEMELPVFAQGEQKKMKLSSCHGKWLILFFYPADFTFVCPTELSEMADLYPEFQRLGAEVISVSTDTIFVHKAWHDHSPSIAKIQFPMASDRTGALCKALGTFIPDEGISLRASFIIDPMGIILTSEIQNNSIGRSGHELLRKLQAAKYVQEHGGEVCPASWKPGSETLKPCLDLVGKI